jgi:hypothetical protein
MFTARRSRSICSRSIFARSTIVPRTPAPYLVSSAAQSAHVVCASRLWNSPHEHFGWGSLLSRT